MFVLKLKTEKLKFSKFVLFLNQKKIILLVDQLALKIQSKNIF